MVLRPLNNCEIEDDESGQYGFLTPFYQDFRNGFGRLLGSAFQAMDYKLAMSVLAPKIDFPEREHMDESSKPLLNLISPYDMKRLEACANGGVEIPMILDLVPVLAHAYFQEKLPVTLSPVQASVLFCMGMQNRDFDHISKVMKLEWEQVKSAFKKVMKKLYNYLYSITAKEIESTLPRLKEVAMAPHSVSVDEDLNEAAKKVMEKMKSENEAVLDSDYLQQYAIDDNGGEFEKAMQNGVNVSASGLISVKSNRTKPENPEKNKETNKRKGKGDDRSRSNKKKKKKSDK